MKFSEMKVTSIPLSTLWNDEGPVSDSRIQFLSSGRIKELLRMGQVQFVIANIGENPRWIPGQDSYRFWKEEAAPHLADPDLGGFRLETFPGEYAYLASLWKCDRDTLVVLFEKYH